MKNLKGLIRKGAGLFLSVFLLSAAALAQAGQGKLYMSGRILDPDGIPVAGVRVKAVLDGKPDVVRETTTDDQGRWNLRSLKKGTWLVSAFTVEMTSELTDVLLNVNRKDIDLPLTRTATGILVEAKSAIYEENYLKALQILSWFIPNFPDSREQAAALFWISHTFVQLSRSEKNRDQEIASLTKALPFLDRLIEEFPKSSWRDDGEILRIELALKLCQSGRPEMAVVIEQGLVIENRSEIDVKLAALDALMSLDRTRAIGYLSNIVLGDPDPGVRTKAAMILGKEGSKEVSALLEKVAANDQDPGVRKTARMWLKR